MDLNAKLILCLFLAFYLCFTNSQLQCRDETNKPVDWFVLYKLPKLKENSNKLIQDGLAYAHITSDKISQGWTLSHLSVSDTKSMPGLTLANLYSGNKSELLWILYNDQPPANTSNDQLGHTKGTIVTQANGGFWLIHSVPHFPPPPKTNSYGYPTTGQVYGQSFLCISLSVNQLDLVGVQLTYNEPDVYSFRVPPRLENLLPHLVAVTRNTKIKVAPWYHQLSLTSRAGQSFQSFAKTSKFEKDLYSGWVADSLKANLLVETWLNGQGKLPSNCKHQYRVENVAQISMTVALANFTTHHDHSKWAAAEDKARPWVCIGDINRESGQFVRGGGTVCIVNGQLWSAYRTVIQAVEPCPRLSTKQTYDIVAV